MDKRIAARRMCRITGWILLALAGTAAGAELFESLTLGVYKLLTLGELWYLIDAAGLNLTQAIVQRYIHPALWDPGITAILLSPAWMVFGIPGLALFLSCRPPPPKHWFRK